MDIGAGTPVGLIPVGNEDIVLTGNPDGGNLLTRFASDATVRWAQPVGLSNLAGMETDDSSTVLYNGEILIDAVRGGVMQMNLARAAVDVGSAVIDTSDGRVFCGTAEFYWDGVYVDEVAPALGPWETSVFSEDLAPKILDFGTVSVGDQSTMQVTVDNVWFSNFSNFAVISPESRGAFEVVRSATAPNVLEVTYHPTASAEPDLAYLRINQEMSSTNSGYYTVVTLMGRSGPSADLTSQQKATLTRYDQAQVQYFLSPDSTNTILGLPCSYWSPDVPRDVGAYVNVHEAGLGLLSLATGAQIGVVSAQLAWSRIELGLHSLQRIQLERSGDLFKDGAFARFLVLRNPDGTDRDVASLTASTDQFSSDDNGLLVWDLLLVEALATRAGHSDLADLAEQIVSRIDLAQFRKPDGSIAMYRTASDGLSSLWWDRKGAEGPAIAAAALYLNQISTSQYEQAIDSMRWETGIWRDKVYVPQAYSYGMIYALGVRAQAGLPVTPEEYAGCLFGATTVPSTVLAHTADMDEQGTDMILSHVMTQTVNGVVQTGIGPGNEDGILLPEDRQSRTGPYAAVVPLARAQWLPADVTGSLFAQLGAYESKYFHGGGLGWEAAVPLHASDPYTGTDAGHAYEALNSAYIALSVFDAVSLVSLSELPTDQVLVGQAMAYVDSGTSIPPNNPPTATSQTAMTDEDTVISATVIGSDVDGNGLSYALVTNAAHGNVAMQRNGSFLYTPAANYNGPDSFTFKASDRQADSAPATVTIAVVAVNDAPVAAGQALTANEGTAASGSVMASDVEGDTLTYSVATQPTYGVLVLQGDGSFTYTPTANYNGADSFSFEANDGQVNSDAAMVSITVRPLRGNFGLTGGRNATVLNLVDGDGDLVSFRLSGGGMGEVYGAGQSFGDVVLTGTGPNSVLTVTVRKRVGGDGLVDIGDLSSDGLIRSISATTTILTGHMELNTLNQPAGKTGASLRFQQIHDAEIGIRQLPVSSLTVAGDIINSRIVTGSSIKLLSAATLLNSDVLLGVAADFDGRFALSAADFANPLAKLESLKVAGSRLPARAPHPAYTAGSHISAPAVGTITLLNVPADSGPVVHVRNDVGTLKVSQSKLVATEMFESGTWKVAGAKRPAIWEVV